MTPAGAPRPDDAGEGPSRAAVDAPLEVALCSVGTEIVDGHQVDTNGAWLARRLAEVGTTVVAHLAVRDDHDAVVRALTWLFDLADVVVVGGGLGPTPDDLTRGAVARAVDRRLTHDSELEAMIRARFDARNARMPESNLRQARIPDGARAYPPVGTAPGFHVAAPSGQRCRDVHVLPGVPWELREMFQRDVAPHVLARAGRGATVTRVLHVTGMGESAVAEAVAPVAAALDGADGAISYLATGDEIEVRLTLRGEDADAARARSEPTLDALRTRLGRAVAAVDADSVEAAIVDLLRRRDQTMAVAESATAGAIAARLGGVPGASAVLRGGVVVYTDAAKRDVLGVPADLLDEHGAVSEAVTRDLAARVRARFDADWGVGLTGVAGPTGAGGPPVGTVVWAVADPEGEVTVTTGRFDGDRAAVQRRAVGAALEALRRGVLDARP